MYKTCVLATRNVETMRINDKVISDVPSRQRKTFSQVLDMLSTKEKVYVGIDTPLPGVAFDMKPEHFHDMMESGMPPYKLRLKVLSLKKLCHSWNLSQEGMIVMLLRNIDVYRGLCNGSRLLVCSDFSFPE